MRSTKITRRSFVAGRGGPSAASRASAALSPVMSRLSALHERSRPGRAARRSARKDEAAYPGYFRRHGLRRRTRARPVRDQFRARAFGRESRDRRGVGCGVRRHRSRVLQRHAGPFGRNGRFARAFGISSGRFRGALGSRGRRAIQYRWSAIPARRRARLRRRNARDDDRGRGRFSNRYPHQHARTGGNFRIGRRCRLRRRLERTARCAG